MKQVKVLFSRIVIALLVIMSMVRGIDVTVLAAGTSDEKVVIYAQVPSDWKNPCVWAWDEEGNNAFDKWPGGEMDQDANNAGWNYIYVPSWATHVIINANQGTVQTDELVLDGGNAWVTVKAADDVTVDTVQQTTGEAPEYVEKFAVHARVDESWGTPCLWAWSAPDGTNAFEAWPGKEMTKSDEDTWYTAYAPVFVNSIIVNGKGGDVQTEDISIDAAEIWVTVDGEGKYDFSYVDPDKAAVENVTVHVSAPSDWSNPCLWAWSAPDGTNVYTTWPGEGFEEGENGWLTKEIPGWVNSVIVNGNEGSVQTADISVEAGKDVWLVVKDAENYELSYEEPTLTVASDKGSNSKNMALPIAGGVGVLAVAGAGTCIARKKKSN